MSSLCRSGNYSNKGGLGVGTSRNKIAVIAALTTTLWPTYALPQQGGAGAGGLQFDIGVSSTMKVDDNFTLVPNSPGTTTVFDNKFDFNLSSVNSLHNLNLHASTVLRYAEFPGRKTSGLEDPNLRLNYTTGNSNSNLALDARYRRVDREFLNPFAVEQDEIDPTVDLLGGGGNVTTRRAGLTFQTGINDPLGFTLALRHDDKSYSGIGALPPATQARLFDTETDRINATVTMRISPVTQFRVNGGLTKYDAEDSVLTDRTTQDYAIGVVQDINPVLVLDAQIGYTDVETTTTGGTVQRTSTTGAVTLTQTLTNGTVFGSINSTLNQNGTRATFRFGRSLQLASGSFAGSLGATRGPGGDNQVVAALSYNRQINNSSDIQITLDRSASTNNSSEDVLDTRLGVNYGYAIDNLSRIDLTMNVARSENIDNSTAPTIDRQSFRASYTRSLTPDWNLTGGFQLRNKKDSTVAAGSARSNSIFLTLDRTFSFRP